MAPSILNLTPVFQVIKSKWQSHNITMSFTTKDIRKRIQSHQLTDVSQVIQ